MLCDLANGRFLSILYILDGIDRWLHGEMFYM